jgi:site-specific DNA recombinase
VTEAGMDAQVLTLFDRLKIQDEKVRDWFLKVLRAGTREGQVQSEEKIAELNRQFTVLRSQQGRLLNLRLLDEIDEQTFAAKNVEMRDRIAAQNLQVQGCDRTRAEQGERKR